MAGVPIIRVLLLSCILMPVAAAAAHYIHAFHTVPDRLSRVALVGAGLLSTRSPGTILAWCFLTIVACSWICIKQNSSFRPSPGGSVSGWMTRRKHIAAERVWGWLGIMCVLGLAPEFAIMWAARQYLSAREISKRHEARGWTLAHAFFIITGGFALHDSEGEFMRTLDIDELEHLESEGTVSWPGITKEQISNLVQSSGWFTLLGNIIAWVEIVWFILSTIIARAMMTQPTHVVTTQVEITTFVIVLTTLGPLTFLWWHKPRGVKASVPVVMKEGYHVGQAGTQSQSIIISEEKGKKNSEPTATRDTPNNNKSAAFNALSLIARIFSASPKWLLFHPDKLRSLFHQHSLTSALKHLTIDLIHIPFFIALQPFRHFVMTLWAMLTSNTDITSSFCAPKLKVDESLGLVYALGTLAAAFYGAIYLLTWTFQPEAYTVLWKRRMGSALISASCAPVVLFIVALVGGHLHISSVNSSDSAWRNVVAGGAVIAACVLADAWAGSRKALIKHAVVEFCDGLPEEAYAYVDWVEVWRSAIS